MSYSNGHSIIHSELKPDNMFNMNVKVKIIYFGLSTQVEPGQSLWCLLFGAPELFHGKLYDSPKNDIWTLKVVLYKLVVR